MKKSKSMMVWRSLLILFIAFLWGGGIGAHAEKKAWVRYYALGGMMAFYYDEYFCEQFPDYSYGYELNEASNEPGWTKYASGIKMVWFDKSFADAEPTSCYKWFANMSKIESISGLEYLNTSKVTNMNSMFYQCSQLTSLDLSGFDTKNVNDMSSMFSGCSNLTTISVTENFVLNNGTVGTDMFGGCKNLKGDISYSSDKVDLSYAKVNGGYFTGKGYTRKAWAEYADGTLTFKYELKGDLGENEYLLNGAATTPGWHDPHAANVTKVAFDETFAHVLPESCSHWFNGCSHLSTFEGLENLNTSNVTDMQNMFSECTSLQSLDLTTFSTGNVTNMSGMFADCSDLQTIYASEDFTTVKVTADDDMFKGCTKLDGDKPFGEASTGKEYATLDGGYFKDKTIPDRPWAKFADGVLTFKYGYKKVFGWGEFLVDTENEQPTPGWSGDSEYSDQIEKVVFEPQFKDAKVKSCYRWFYLCYELKTIEGLKYLNTSYVTSMQSMFAYCPFTSLDLTSFDTKNVRDMSRMFYDCGRLTSLDVSNFDTSKVTDMKGMFFACSTLPLLDLTSFDTKNMNDMSFMFYKCPNLNAIYFGDKFDVEKLNSIDNADMFSNCPVTLYCSPLKYENFKNNSVIASAGNAVKPYVGINKKSEYGTICVPVGSSLAEDSFTGFDKLYQVTNADKDKGTITLAEAKSIEPGVPYVYHRYLEGVDFDGDNDMSIITFDVDENASAAVSAPKNEGSMLKGTFESIVAIGGSYILQSDGNFHPVAADNKTLKVGAYRAYLDLSSTEIGGVDEGVGAAKAYRMVFEDGEATGIDRINGEGADGSDKGVYDQADQQPKVYFDLMGRKVNAPQKGEIYIVNGKKVVYNK